MHADSKALSDLNTNADILVSGKQKRITYCMIASKFDQIRDD